MNKAKEIIRAIKQLEVEIQELKQELTHLQECCVHEYRSNHLMKTCDKCMHSESIYY